MTGDAEGFVNLPSRSGWQFGLIHQRVVVAGDFHDGWQFGGADVEQLAFRVETGASPFGSSMCARQHDDRHPRTMGLVEAKSLPFDLFQDVSSSLGRTSRYFIEGKLLANERLGEYRRRLVGRGEFARGRRGRGSFEAKGKERFSGQSIQYEGVSHLGDLGDGVYLSSISGHGDQVGGAWDVEVPYVVSYLLKVPDSLACECVDGDHAIGEQVDPSVGVADEVRFWGTRADVGDAASGIQ